MEKTVIVVIGAGFSGTMAAAHLLRRGIGRPLEVVIINRSGPMARGLAYGTKTEVHVLNVPAGRMGAFPDDEAGFLRFVRRRNPCVESGDFLPRKLYGDYLEWILAESETRAAPDAALTRVVGETESVEFVEGSRQVDVVLKDGRTIRADRVLLALGNYSPADPPIADRSFYSSPRYVRDPWAPGALANVPPSESVLLVGTGLTMADIALSLRRRGARKPIYVVSRRGLLPQAHRSPSVAPTHSHLPPDLTTGPATVRAYLHSIRKHVKALAEEGVDWREVVGSLRPVTPGLWRALDTTERARFLRHVRVYWEIHRHRAAPEIAAELDDMIAKGELVPIAGRVVAYRETETGVEARVRLRLGEETRRLDVSTVVNCTGPESDVRTLDEPLIRSLRERGLLRSDTLGLGLETTDDYALLDSEGNASSVLYYVGPLLKATHWESTAVPELRVHAAKVAEILVRSV